MTAAGMRSEIVTYGMFWISAIGVRARDDRGAEHVCVGRRPGEEVVKRALELGLLCRVIVLLGAARHSHDAPDVAAAFERAEERATDVARGPGGGDGKRSR
ncbi:MAG: hypothetical protein M3071_04370 [Actinomycetota bacterium]|nr:hypothetical protein [Actinomycetota bacterium]